MCLISPLKFAFPPFYILEDFVFLLQCLLIVCHLYPYFCCILEGRIGCLCHDFPMLSIEITTLLSPSHPQLLMLNNFLSFSVNTHKASSNLRPSGTLPKPPCVHFDGFSVHCHHLKNKEGEFSLDPRSNLNRAVGRDINPKMRVTQTLSFCPMLSASKARHRVALVGSLLSSHLLWRRRRTKQRHKSWKERCASQVDMSLQQIFQQECLLVNVHAPK